MFKELLVFIKFLIYNFVREKEEVEVKGSINGILFILL